MKIIEVTKKDIITVNRALPLRKLLQKFKDFQASPLIPVVDNQNILIGVVYSENLLDLLRPQHTKLFRNIPFIEMDEDVFDLEPVPYMGDLIIVDDIMDSSFGTVNKDDSFEDAYKAMRMFKKESLPVVDNDNRIVGILGIFNIIWRMFKEKQIV